MVDSQCGYVRYADDFIVLCHTEEEAIEVQRKVVALLADQLKLTLNEGTAVVSAYAGFEFLGIFFKDGLIGLSNKKKDRLLEKMREASQLGKELVTEKLKETVKGIAQFYGKLLPESTLEELDKSLLEVIAARFESFRGKNLRMVNPTKIVSDQLSFISKSYNLHKTDWIREAFQIEKSASLKNGGGKVKTAVLFNSHNAVIKRKHEYQKLEASGFDLVLSQSGLMLGKRENSVIVKRNDVLLEEVPVSNLKNITLLSNGICLSTNVIQLCAENNVSIDMLRYNGMPYAMLLTEDYPDSEIGVAQLKAYENNKGCQLIKGFLIGKISNQMNMIKYFGKYYKAKHDLFNVCYEPTLAKMMLYKESIKKLNDDDLDSLRQKAFAFEGLASSLYWDMVKHLISKKTHFEGRTKVNSKDLFNCLLNYGYGILYARIAEALSHARLNLSLSYLHKPERNRPSLVYDLIEEFRQQAVDRVVIAMIIKHKGLACVDGLLEDKTKALLVRKVIGRLNEVENFRGKELRLFEIIQTQAHAVSKFLTEESPRYKPYIKKW
jgi:CRISPR-associated endonuclease Cas1